MFPPRFNAAVPSAGLLLGMLALPSAARAGEPSLLPEPSGPVAIEQEGTSPALSFNTDGGDPALDQAKREQSEAQTNDALADDPSAPPGTQASIKGPFLAAGGEVEMGSGTFIIDEASRNEYIAWNGLLMPGYRFADRTRIAASIGIAQELTQNDADSKPHQLLLSDIRLSVSRPIYTWESSKTQLVGEIGAVAPTSLRSQFEGLYTGVDARLQIRQPVGDFFFAFRTAFRKNFHHYTTPILSEDDLAADQENGLRTELAREGGNERVSAGIAVGLQNNVSHTWSNQLLAAYSFSEQLSLSLMYQLAHGWTYESYPNDELTAAGAQAGSRRGDASAADISLAYEALDNLEIAGGVRTLTSPRTADDKAIRFPFYEFSNAELNLSVFYLSATVTEKIPL